MANPFISTRHLTDRREDHLTEFFAGALDLDEQFRCAYAELVIVPYARTRGWLTPRIVRIATQGAYDDICSRPDMILTLEDGHVIAVEHKLEAQQTMVAVPPQGEDEVAQLVRYLSSTDIHGVAFVRTTLKPPEPAILEHPNYMRPPHRQHYLWRDFYPLLEASSSRYCEWLRDGFKKLGFTPPHPMVGDLSVPENRENFAKFWDRTKVRAAGLGWRVQTGNKVELYLQSEKGKFSRSIWVSPTDGMLVFRADPVSPDASQALLDRLRMRLSSVSDSIEVARRKVPRKGGALEVVDVSISLRNYLGEQNSSEGIEEKLLQFVEPLLSEVA